MSLGTPADKKQLKEMIEQFYAIANDTPPQLLKINDEVKIRF